MTEENVIWIENEPLTPEGEKIAEILKGMEPLEMALTILHVLSKVDIEVMKIIRSRNVFELRRLIRKKMAEMGLKEEMAEMEKELFTTILWEESDGRMRKYFPAECE